MANSNRRTKQGFKYTKHLNLQCHNMSRDEDPQRENEMDSQVLKVFMLSEIASLHVVIKT